MRVIPLEPWEYPQVIDHEKRQQEMDALKIEYDHDPEAFADNILNETDEQFDQAFASVKDDGLSVTGGNQIHKIKRRGLRTKCGISLIGLKMAQNQGKEKVHWISHERRNGLQ